MKFLRFLFTARLSLVLFVFLAFALTFLYLNASQLHQAPVAQQSPPAGQRR